MEEPEIINDLLYLKREERKVKLLEKIMEKRLKGAIKAKPRAYAVKLYKDCIKLQGHKKVIFLNKVKVVKQFKDHLVLVLSSESKAKWKHSLTTMKFKTPDSYASVLCSLTEAMKAQESQVKENGSQQRSTESEQGLSKGNLSENDPVPPESLCLPRVNVPESIEYPGYVKNAKKFYSLDSGTAEQAKMEELRRAKGRRRVCRTASKRFLNTGYTAKRSTSWNEDSDHCSSFTSDPDFYFESSDSESDSTSRYHYKRDRQNNKEFSLVVPKSNDSKEFIQDSQGNLVHVIRPRTTQPRSMVR
ncbi:hypothetical protein ECG_01873 [Echinococcus granulosus]|uniref:Expressed conserved protein n=1 Tax=Echinococcus granulosus TaxID=6210 RepID=U6IYB1_ECHGR|nr:hypothetical protein EGR_05995 [Echinococcus granulosus]EUB59132.1 hypothetical protein EGR_05995 [Echinococcus granulosus]KAH9286617.1 hypothetical protein ECG_01873 [Echinococcus granulosus]CDS15169.1 expressed conserved protein [Echinococcus granulosus]